MLLIHESLDDSALLLRPHLLAIAATASLLLGRLVDHFSTHNFIFVSRRLLQSMVLISTKKVMTLEGSQVLTLQELEDIASSLRGILETTALAALLSDKMLEARK